MVSVNLDEFLSIMRPDAIVRVHLYDADDVHEGSYPSTLYGFDEFGIDDHPQTVTELKANRFYDAVKRGQLVSIAKGGDTWSDVHVDVVISVALSCRFIAYALLDISVEDMKRYSKLEEELEKLKGDDVDKSGDSLIGLA